jgi:hypothetical protein
MCRLEVALMDLKRVTVAEPCREISEVNDMTWH